MLQYKQYMPHDAMRCDVWRHRVLYDLPIVEILQCDVYHQHASPGRPLALQSAVSRSAAVLTRQKVWCRPSHDPQTLILQRH